MSTPVKAFRYWLEFCLVACFARLIPLVPWPVLRFLANTIGSIVYLADRRARKVALANLTAAFGNNLPPKRRRQIAHRSLQVFARTFLELFWTPRLNSGNVTAYVRFEDPAAGQAFIERHRQQSQIGVTPHFGNFEWGSALFALSGLPGIILTQRFKNDRLTSIFQRTRESSGHRVVTQESSMVRLFKNLRKGVSVGILTDLTLRMRHPAVIIRSFGLLTRTSFIHALLHARTGAPIQPFITLPRPDGGYLVRLLDPLTFPAETPLADMVQHCWNQFEPIIRKYPEQWLWMYKHWRFRPETDQANYPFYANRSPAFDEELAMRGNDSPPGAPAGSSS